MFGVMYEVGGCETEFEEFSTKEALLDFIDEYLIGTMGYEELESYTIYVTHTREEIEQLF